MTTRPYDDCLTQALALCGIPDASAVEVARVGAYINLAAQRAYDECDYWPRFLRTEERICSEEGLLPYSEDGLEDIGVCRRLHATEPFAECGAGEYLNYVARADGIQIAGYCPRAYSGYGPIRVQGAASPAANGIYYFTGLGGVGADGETSAPQYARTDITTFLIQGSLSFTASAPPLFLGYLYRIGPAGSNYWQSGTNTAYTTPDLADGTYTGEGAAIDSGDGLSVTAVPTYSVWVTYKAAFEASYASGDEVPAEWFRYMSYAAYAHWLRGEGQQEKAAIEDNFAVSNYLMPQLEKLDNQSGGHVFTRVANHANTQR